MASSTSRTVPILGLAWPLLVLGLMAALGRHHFPGESQAHPHPGAPDLRREAGVSLQHRSGPLGPTRRGPGGALSRLGGRLVHARPPYNAPLEPGRYDIFIILEEYDLRWHKQGGYEAMGAQTAGPAPRGTRESLRQERIPTRFMAPGTSGLWITIKREPRSIKCYDIALRD